MQQPGHDHLTDRHLSRRTILQGTFGGAETFDVGAGFTLVVAADLDQNGANDLALLGLRNVKVLRNLGGGTFAVPQVVWNVFPFCNGASLLAGDLDG